jgi:hypothetical protein
LAGSTKGLSYLSVKPAFKLSQLVNHSLAILPVMLALVLAGIASDLAPQRCASRSQIGTAQQAKPESKLAVRGGRIEKLSGWENSAASKNRFPAQR